MSIRLNKAISELNIGLQTAVDFLKKEVSSETHRKDQTPSSPTSSIKPSWKHTNQTRKNAHRQKSCYRKSRRRKSASKKNRAPATEIHSIRENRPRQYRQEAVGTICCLSFKTRRKQGKSFCRKPAGKRGQSSCAAAKDNGPTAAK